MLNKNYSLHQIADIAREVIDQATSKVLAFHAPMGAGKTTLIKALLRELGTEDTGNSPTFGIVNEYVDQQGNPFAYHFDFYRLNEETEALDLGLEDYLNQDAWIFMEWPEKIHSYIPKEANEIHIRIVDVATRNIKMRNNS